MINMTDEEIEEMIDRMEYMRETMMKKDKLTNKKFIAGRIIRYYKFDNKKKRKHVVRNRKYYKELREKLTQESMERIKENSRKIRES